MPEPSTDRASPAASPPSPPRPPSPSTPRPRPSRPQGEDVIGFGAGEPDFPTPDHIVEAAVEACRDPSNHRYTPAAGLPELREAVAAKTARDSGYEVEAAQVLVTNGGKHAVYNTLAALLDPGDEVLLPAPVLDHLPRADPPGRRRAGGDRHRRDDAASGSPSTSSRRPAPPQTKALVFVSPSNPTGAVYPRDEVEAIGRWAVEHGIWVITDEIYEHLTYGDHEFTSMPVVVPELADRCVVLNGVAKTYAMTGWRVGWMIGPADVVKAAANLQSPPDLQRGQRLPAGRAGRGLAAASTPWPAMREAFDRRGQDDARAAQRHRRRVLLPSPRAPSTPSPSFRDVLERGTGGRPPGHHHRRAGRGDPRGGQGGHRPRRGVRRPGLRPPVLRPRRRRPGRGHPAHRRPAWTDDPHRPALRVVALAGHRRGAGGRRGLRVGEVAVDGDDVWWSEPRPSEGGRTALVRRRRRRHHRGGPRRAARARRPHLERPHRAARVRRRRLVRRERGRHLRPVGRPAPPPAGGRRPRCGAGPAHARADLAPRPALRRRRGRCDRALGARACARPIPARTSTPSPGPTSRCTEVVAVPTDGSAAEDPSPGPGAGHRRGLRGLPPARPGPAGLDPLGPPPHALGRHASCASARLGRDAEGAPVRARRRRRRRRRARGVGRPARVGPRRHPLVLLRPLGRGGTSTAWSTPATGPPPEVVAPGRGRGRRAPLGGRHAVVRPARRRPRPGLGDRSAGPPGWAW